MSVKCAVFTTTMMRQGVYRWSCHLSHAAFSVLIRQFRFQESDIRFPLSLLHDFFFQSTISVTFYTRWTSPISCLDGLFWKCCLSTPIFVRGKSSFQCRQHRMHHPTDGAIGFPSHPKKTLLVSFSLVSLDPLSSLFYTHNRV